jgi:hypothetical protein
MGISFIVAVVNLDRHRESLTKYCYDVSKVALAVAVVNPLVTKSLSLTEVFVGLLGSIGFLILAILIEKGRPS